MRRPRTARWQLLMFPPIGERLTQNRCGRSCTIPFLAWVYHLLYACMTLRLALLGIIALGPAATLLLAGFAPRVATLGYAVIAMIVASMFIGWLLRPRVVVQSVYPQRVESGRRFTIRYQVTNLGRGTACDVDVETLPHPNILDLRLQRVSLAALPAGQTRAADGAGHALRRGRYLLPPLRWDTDFPFGLWRCGRTDWATRQLTVHPASTPLKSLDLPLGPRNTAETPSPRQLARSAIEFHGCREYRPGDALRHLHPRSFARLGTPVVKEFQAEGHGRTAILVDTWRKAPTPELGLMADPVVEATLSLTAAMVEWLAREDRVLELLVAGPGLYRFESAGRAGYVEEVLDILASVEPVTKDPLPKLTPVLISEIRAIQSVCLVLGRWDARRATLVRELRDWQVGVKTVLVQRRRTPRRPHGLPVEAACVTARAVRRGEVIAL